MITVLHISDPQFGKEHRFGIKDQPFDSLCQRLEDDLHGLKKRYGLQPDLVAITGDLAEWGMGHEFKQAYEFLERLSNHLVLKRGRIAIIPGNHDVNRNFCRAYFNECAGAGEEPTRPFWPKWKSWVDMFNKFYDGHQGICFTESEPWTLYEMTDLKVVVAGLNSTILESHRDEDHYGHLGESQLRWFAERLEPYRRLGWFRIGLVHHNLNRGAVDDDENLRDSQDLNDILGPFLNVVLHGHTHNGRMERLGSNVPIFSTGSAGLKRGALPSDIPNQYQILRLSRKEIKCYARYFAPEQKRWIGDNRFSVSGDDWRSSYEIMFQDVDETFPKSLDIQGDFVGSVDVSPAKVQLDTYPGVDLVLEVSHQWHPEELVVGYRFYSPSGIVSLGGEVACHQTVHAPESMRQDLLRELSKFHQGYDIEGRPLLSKEVLSSIEDIGHRLYSRLLPQPAREIFRHSRGKAKSLLVVTDDPWIPWEILKPFDDADDDFFCLQFEMSRWLSSALPALPVKTIKSLACIAVANAPERQVLNGVEEEVHFINDLVAGLPGVDGLTLEDALFEDTIRILNGGLDLFHFAGYGEDSGIGTDMAKIELIDRPLRVRQLSGPLGRRLQQDRPVVFINAGGGSGLGGWAEGWVGLGGASVFVAPMWPVDDISSSIFAKTFYREIHAKRRLAEAVCIARRELRDKNPAGIEWLGYRVYGNPNARIIFGEDIPE